MFKLAHKFHSKLIKPHIKIFQNRHSAKKMTIKILYKKNNLAFFQALWRRLQQLLRQHYRWIVHHRVKFIMVEYQYFDQMKRVQRQLWEVHILVKDAEIRTQDLIH